MPQAERDPAEIIGLLPLPPPPEVSIKPPGIAALLSPAQVAASRLETASTDPPRL